MSDQFFDSPVLNSPYECPSRYWELDEGGQPTGAILDSRRQCSLQTPVPSPKKRKRNQAELALGDADGPSTPSQQYDPIPIINEVRSQVSVWRSLPASEWQVTPETARLLQHWRSHDFKAERPFFCQIEAMETAIWLTEVAPKHKKRETTAAVINHLAAANEVSDSQYPVLPRLALKLATGAGKTTVMAMLIAWQTINAVRHPGGSLFTRGFLVVTPGITIRDRLRVLKPSDPDSYYKSRELVPEDMLHDLGRAEIVITNYHAFMRRETANLSKGGRSLLYGNGKPEDTRESKGQMLQRVCPQLLGMKHIVVFNDEAHHCYRERTSDSLEADLKGDLKEEAEKNTEAARVWISGLEAIAKTRGLNLLRVFDLSATPFFLSGSGYQEGTLFPWTMSDFSLLDAIECGIVKLPRVPVSDNIPHADVPVFRNLWAHIGKALPSGRRAKKSAFDPAAIPVQLQTALQALYGHYERTFEAWDEANIDVPPCFIIVCNNTSTSKLVYDYVSGYERVDEDGNAQVQNGALALFRNYDQNNRPLARPRTLLIDSIQIESGEALDKRFSEVAADEVERFKRERVERSGNISDRNNISDQDLLREVLNTVGKLGRLGESIRCVVSVAMLSEGWDANTVTHILGVRAFGTQLLCEQVVGRALRRQDYKLNEWGLLDPEYADVLGIPFDFTSKPQVVVPPRPQQRIHVQAVSPERDAKEIRFPHVAGYRVELPESCLQAKFDEHSTLELTPEIVGPTITTNEGLIGESAELNLEHLDLTRPSTVEFHLTKHLYARHWSEFQDSPDRFGQLRMIVRRWLKEHLVCKGNTYCAQLLYLSLAEKACEKITRAIVNHFEAHQPVKALLQPFTPEGSTAGVDFTTSTAKTLWRTHTDLCHVNYAVCDSEWEAEFCRIVEAHARTMSYVKNTGLGFEVPYFEEGIERRYVPDFIVRAFDSRAWDDLLNIVVEIKGVRDENAKTKADTMNKYWVPGVNRLGNFGRWAFIELTDVTTMEADYQAAFTRLLPKREVEAAKWLANAGGSAPNIQPIPRRRSTPSP